MATPPSRPSSALEARAAATTTPDAASTGQLTIEPQTLLILVGLPGAGKTTFATALCALPPRLGKRTWSRASQDDSPSKRRAEAEAAARAGLRRGDNVVVDRVDFDPDRQRAHFITLARDANVRVFCLVLSPPLATLRQRLSTRTGHPTLPDAQTALGVLDRMRSQFVPPSRGEGIDRTLTITAWDEGVEAVLARLEDGVADKDLPPAARNTASGTRDGGITVVGGAMARGDTTEEGMRREPGIQHLEAGTLAAAATEVVMATTPGGMSSMEMPPTLCMPTATPMTRRHTSTAPTGGWAGVLMEAQPVGYNVDINVSRRVPPTCAT
ncbi:uncharacterized protein EHS24_003929 [Apiotrichum porosum]|uniref:Uncharacterized protein n=1 Tax=Apiotrichum porosum TaxID=105984 RepID=A0A427XDJ4_9TREE|nr:uncharacterized protein EHS24_003929 [Apiotrichum porosum]RSH76990.1 hypothetical protein EHS24_003929 [Apiotrichum porosum]